jgi:xanthine dehydrogenase accessory factor
MAKRIEMKSATGKIVGVYVGAKRGEGKKAVESAELIAGYGVRDDSHAGLHPDRQISLFESEVLRELETEGITVPAETLSTNLIIEGINLNALGVGSRLQIGDAIIELAEVRKPCGSLTKLDRRLPKRLYQRCGMLSRILKGGTVHLGEEVKVNLLKDSARN